jgi:hypothetical protein
MAKLADVQLSQTGEPQVKESSFIPTLSSSTVEAPPLRFVVFKLVKRRRRLWLDGCSEARNPKTQKMERIWLLNGADSIWQSELGDLLKDRKYMSRQCRSLLFEDGVCMVKAEDEKAVEFARLHKHNVGKKNYGNGKYDFYEYKPAEEQEERLKRQMLKINMVIKAREMPVEQMKKLASFFNISFVDEIGMPKTDEGVRSELMLRADNNPEVFEKYIDSQEVEISYLIKRAILDAKIDLTGQHGNAIWANGKGFIAKIPAGRKPYEYLTELAMTNSDEGRKFKEQLQTLIS